MLVLLLGWIGAEGEERGGVLVLRWSPHHGYASRGSRAEMCGASAPGSTACSTLTADVRTTRS